MLEETYVPLSLIILAILFLSFITDVITKATETACKAIPGLPDYFDNVLSFIFTFGVSYFICLDGNIDLFKYFNIEFQHDFIGLALTAIIIAGGTKVLKERLELASMIPMSITNAVSTMKNVVNKNKNQ